MPSHLLFVYGSLKRGQENHHFLAAAEFIARARTVERAFRLVDLGPYPALIRSADQPRSIIGELFVVDDDTLLAADELEESGTLYQRELLRVQEVDAPTRQHEAWAYLYLQNVVGHRLWPGEEWSSP